MEEHLPQKSQFLIYQTEDGKIKLDVRFDDNTVWLTQQLMAELFQTTVPNINMHIKNIIEEGELEKEASIKVSHPPSRVASNANSAAAI